MPTAFTGTPIAPQVRGVTAATTTSVSTPSTVEVGDLILAFIALRTGESMYLSGITLDDDWAWALDLDFLEGSFSSNPIGVAYKIATVAGTQAVDAIEDGDYEAIGCVVLEKETFDADSITSDTYAADEVLTSAAPDPAEVTTPIENCLIFAVGLWNFSSTPTTVAVTPPTGYTEAWEMSGSNEVEFAVAYKAVEFASTEDPSAFADDATPDSTSVLTFAIRPYGWRATVEIPETGDDRTEDICQPAWENNGYRERFLLDRMPKVYHDEWSQTSTPNPLDDDALMMLQSGLGYTDNTTDHDTHAGDDTYVDIPNCVVGDQLLIEISFGYWLNSVTWGSGNSSPWWDVRIRVNEDWDGTPVEIFPDNRFFGAEFGNPFKVGVGPVPVKLVYAHTVTAKGKVHVDLWASLLANGGNDNVMGFYDIAIKVTHFPTAFSPATPTLSHFEPYDPEVPGEYLDLADTLGGDTVTIYGDNLGNMDNAEVRVDGTPVTMLSNNGRKITFEAPAKAAGSYDVEVETQYGTTPDPLSLEFWNIGLESGVTAFGEHPDYEVTGVGPDFLPCGVFSMRVGSDWTKDDVGAEEGAPNEYGDGGGSPYFTGAGSYVQYLEGPELNTLWDLSGAQAGSVGVCLAPLVVDTRSFGSPETYPAYLTVKDTTAKFSIGGEHDTVGCWFMLRTDTGAQSLFLDTDTLGGAEPLYWATPRTHFARFTSGTVLDGVMDFQVDGRNSAKLAGGFDTATGFNTVDASTETAIMGMNCQTSVAPYGVLRAFFFANVSLSNTVAKKWRKWCRIRHGAL